MIDTHAHLDAAGDGAGAWLERARAVGVTRVVAVGSGIASCRETLALAEREEAVFAALGIHPHQAGDADERELADLRALLEHPKVVAVGETGLDYFRDYAPRERQRELFAAQLALAADLGLPVVVHSRAADEDTAALLAHARDGVPVVVLHCFSSLGLLGPAVAGRYYVSFAGNVTYPKAVELREAAVRVPADRILAETDAPYLAPQPVRGRTNEPANVVHTVAAGGRELEVTIDANASAAFALP